MTDSLNEWHERQMNRERVNRHEQRKPRTGTQPQPSHKEIAMKRYSTTVEPLSHDDPRSANRSAANRAALDALREAGLKPSVESTNYAKCARHAAKMDEALELVGRNALVTEVAYL